MSEAIPTNGTSASDLEIDSIPGFDWSLENTSSSIASLFRWVEAEALTTYRWYMNEKRGKSRFSKSLRVVTVTMLTFGAAFPVLSLVTSGIVRSEWGYLALTIGGGAMLLDKAFGYSSSWTRYMTTSSAIARRTAQLQMDWTLWQARTAELSSPNASDFIGTIIIPFVNDIGSLVETETKSWTVDLTKNISELHSSLAHHGK